MYFKFLLSIFFCLFINNINAQQPTDCNNAVIACGNSEINLDVSGIGTQELSGSNTCSSQENNSVWLKVTLITNGTLGFTLTPASAAITEDYDVFDKLRSEPLLLEAPSIESLCNFLKS